MPAIMMAGLSLVAPATPTTTPAVETIPSLAPRTAARNQLSREANRVVVGLAAVVDQVIRLRGGHRPIVASHGVAVRQGDPNRSA